jgi:hypothetical protein
MGNLRTSIGLMAYTRVSRRSFIGIAALAAIVATAVRWQSPPDASIYSDTYENHY